MKADTDRHVLTSIPEESGTIPTPQGSSSDPTPSKEKRRSLIGWFLRVVAWLVGGFVGVLLLLTLLLYIPDIQTYVVNRTVQGLERSLGLQIHVGQVRVGFPLRILIGEVKGLTTEGDSALFVDRLAAEVGVIPILRGEEIPVSGIELSGTKLNYTFPNDSLILKGHVGTIRGNLFRYQLKDPIMSLDNLLLRDGDVSVVAITDTLPNEQPKQDPTLVINLGKLVIDNVKGSFSNSRDSLIVDVELRKGYLTDGLVNLREGFYEAGNLELEGTLYKAGPNLDILPYPWNVEVQGRNIHYGGAHDVYGLVKNLSYEVGDGWSVKKANFDLKKDATRMRVRDLSVALNSSRIVGDFDLPFDQWLPGKVGDAELNLKGVLSLADLGRFIKGTESYPKDPVNIELTGKGEMEGNLIVKGDVSNDDILELKVEGDLFALFDEKERTISGTYDISTKKGTMEMINQILSQAHKDSRSVTKPSWKVPGGLHLAGSGLYGADVASADFTLTTPRGLLDGEVVFGLENQKYRGDLQFRDLDVGQFVPRDTLGVISGSAKVDGKGLDFFADNTEGQFLLMVDTLFYEDQSFHAVRLEGQLQDHHLYASLDANHEALKMNTLVNAQLLKEETDLNLTLKVDTIVPSMLGLETGEIRGASLELMSNLKTDFKQTYSFSGQVNHFSIQTDNALISPTDTYITAETSADSIAAKITSGDLLLHLTSGNGLEEFGQRIQKVAEVVQITLSDSLAEHVDVSQWMTHYPSMDLTFEMGRNNALRAYLERHRMGAQYARLSLRSRTNSGLRGDGYVHMFQSDTFRINDMDLVLRQDSDFFYAIASAHKDRFRHQVPFDLVTSITSNVRRSEANIKWVDEEGKDYVRMGIGLWSEQNGDLKIDFTPDPIVLAYNQLTVDPGNFVRLPKENRMKLDADIMLRSNDGGNLHLYDENTSDSTHLVKLDINNLILSGLAGVPFVPQLSGSLTANALWMQRPRNNALYTVNGRVNGLYFEDKEVGDLGLQGIAEQSKQGILTQAMVTMDKAEVADLRYFSPADSSLDPLLYLKLEKFPLDRANPFLPPKLFTVSGFATGVVSNYDANRFTKDLSQVVRTPIQGNLTLNESDLFIPLLNETYRVDDKQIYVQDGYLRFDDYGFNANGKRIQLDGTFGLTGRFPMDITIGADNITILDSKPSKDAILYGRINADVDLQLRGSVDALDLSGEVGLLGSTNVTYETRNSEPTSGNGYKGLVTFVDFSDTLFIDNRHPLSPDSLTLGGTNMDVRLHVDPAAQITAILTPDGGNKVQVKGGGDLHLTMPPYGEMQLTGKYTMESGSVHVEMNPISKKFEIDEGSSLVWSGDVLKPVIKFTATSHVNARVAPPGEEPRNVDFDVKVLAENSLDNLKIRFQTDAPEDLSIRNQLLAMNEQEQTRQSAMLLTTGQFIGSGTGVFDAGQSRGQLVNNFLTSYLASQINSFAGDALDAEINFGINNATTASGTGTNYSYSIAKSFLNDRIHVVVGGKVMTGAAAYGMEQTFIDNMSLEYQLDEAGTHYLRLFHNKNFENLLDGEVIETGAGYVLRRRLNRLRELFDLRMLKADPLPLLPKKEDRSSQSETKSVSNQAVGQEEKQSIVPQKKPSDDK